MTLDIKKRELIEKIGVFHEKFGFQPVAARIYGLLLVSDQPELTFDEIKDELMVSKSAVSNALNLLMSMKQVDYITKPGDRKRYFKTNLTNWKVFMTDLLQFAKSYGNLFKEILQVRNGHDPDFNKTIDDLVSFIDFIINSYPELLKNWEKTRI
ncbi:MAG TPA: MarR family transcriptional regulator [Bacteroidia bacterium]|nr:MarR family transcriptional regulator [Sphingobacteriales bacterium]HPD65381.1 MarR family transcriptional regulator [Bacteroidia bacterium]HRS58871.1 MarR family transcriptional regulator [Bacteroidia bacterium]HRU67368.1 MarR family transcriptional regulator [Bacteroidia bacterium]